MQTKDSVQRFRYDYLTNRLQSLLAFGLKFIDQFEGLYRKDQQFTRRETQEDQTLVKMRAYAIYFRAFLLDSCIGELSILYVVIHIDFFNNQILVKIVMVKITSISSYQQGFLTHQQKAVNQLLFLQERRCSNTDYSFKIIRLYLPVDLCGSGEVYRFLIIPKS